MIKEQTMVKLKDIAWRYKVSRVLFFKKERREFKNVLIYGFFDNTWGSDALFWGLVVLGLFLCINHSISMSSPAANKWMKEILYLLLFPAMLYGALLTSHVTRPYLKKWIERRGWVYATRFALGKKDNIYLVFRRTAWEFFKGLFKEGRFYNGSNYAYRYLDHYEELVNRKGYIYFKNEVIRLYFQPYKDFYCNLVIGRFYPVENQSQIIRPPMKIVSRWFCFANVLFFKGFIRNMNTFVKLLTKDKAEPIDVLSAMENGAMFFGFYQMICSAYSEMEKKYALEPVRYRDWRSTTTIDLLEVSCIKVGRTLNNDNVRPFDERTLLELICLMGASVSDIERFLSDREKMELEKAENMIFSLYKLHAPKIVRIPFAPTQRPYLLPDIAIITLDFIESDAKSFFKYLRSHFLNR